MLRNMDNEILDLDGKSLDPKLTLKDVCLQACLANLQPDPSADEKVALWKLAKKVHLGDIVPLTAEELALLKSRIARIYAVAATGRAFELLEQDYPAPPVEPDYDASLAAVRANKAPLRNA